MTEKEDLIYNLAKELIIYKAFDENGLLELKRYGKDYDGGYIIPKKAMEKADVFIGYGLEWDPSMEESFSYLYDKPSFAFDCGPVNLEGCSCLFTFIPECIASNKFLSREIEGGNGQVGSFSSHIKKLDLEDKKIFLKMDIDGNEFYAIDEILEYHYSNITGIVMEIHLNDEPTRIGEGIDLLKKLHKDFVLMHVHANNNGNIFDHVENIIGNLPQIFEVSLINKNLVSEYFISNNQKHPTELDMPSYWNINDIFFEIKI